MKKKLILGAAVIVLPILGWLYWHNDRLNHQEAAGDYPVQPGNNISTARPAKPALNWEDLSQTQKLKAARGVQVLLDKLAARSEHLGPAAASCIMLSRRVIRSKSK